MCGISATLYKEHGGSRHLKRIALSREMSEILSHRGPDGQKNWSDRMCYLGFRHLALVGDNQSLQSLTNERNDVHMVCNGEIYNCNELYADLLTKGHNFSTRSDCEVIIHLYEEYGDRLCSFLQGQFAFVLWDATKRRMIAARDRFGICPLFYTKTSDRIIFGSEIKALFCDTSILPVLDLRGIAETALMYGPIPPATCFKNIFQVPPGACIIVDAARWDIKTKRYWTMDIRDHFKGTDDEVLRTFNFLYINAVRRRLQGNFLPAVYASGGLDSSVTAVVLKTLLGRVGLFSLQFDDTPVDESYYQLLLAKHIDATLHPVRIHAEDICNNLLHCVWHCETPLTRLAPVPMMLLSRRVRAAGYKCVLSGEGADELLAGYPVLLKNKASVQEKYRSAKKMLYLFGDKSIYRSVEKMFRSFISSHAGHSKSRLEQSQEIEIQTKLSRYLLATQGDRVALSSGVEQRFPFLDEPLVDFLVKLPARWKRDNNVGKVLLKRLFTNVLPEQIIQREKQGYVAPDAAVFRSTKFIQTCNNKFLSDSVISSSGYFDIKLIRRLRQLATHKAISDDVLARSSWLFVVTTQMLQKLFVEKDREQLFSTSAATCRFEH